MTKTKATSADHWFDVDRKGLAKQLARKGKALALFELIQNAWDEPGVTRVDVRLKQSTGRARWHLFVEDDAPDGFADLTHAYRMFADSKKAGAAELRGRFNVGEKLVLAICEHASVISTTGCVWFREDGSRESIDDRTERGSIFEAIVNITKAEAEEALRECRRLIPPAGIDTWVNGELLAARVPALSFETSLPTILEDEDGVLRTRTRRTTVTLYDTEEGETPSIYELGIPVVENNDRWSYDVGQKVPLNTERDNVPPGYLRRLRTEVANVTADLLTEEESKATWVNEALSDERIEPEAVRQIVATRFGEDAVVYDPSDREANKLAAAEGRPVIYGSSLPKAAWDNLRRANREAEESGATPVMLPAGRVTPSPVLALSPDGVPPIPEDEWSDGMRRTATYAQQLAEVVGVGRISVRWMEKAHNTLGGGCAGAFGHGELRLNKQAIGHEPTQQAIDELLIHEFGHHWSIDHFDLAFLRACCRVGARMAWAAREGRLPTRLPAAALAASEE